MNRKQQLVMDAFREIDTIAFEEFRDSDSKLNSIQSLLYQVQECQTAKLHGWNRQE